MSADPILKSALDVEQTAADWLARFDRDGLLGAADVEDLCREDEVFAAWIAEDTGHRVAFLRAHSAWQRAERLSVFRGNGAAPSRPLVRRPLVQALAAAACVAMAVFAAGTYGLLNFGPDAPQALSYQTVRGEIRTITLEDGSELTLNTETSIKVAFEAGARNVELFRGEVFFDVASAPGRPFRIDAGEGRVEVLGTSFGVERREGLVEVAVSEGTVWMNNTGEAEQSASVLKPGMIGYAGPDGLLVETSGLDAVGDRLLWRTGRVRFDNTPLSEVAAEFNRYNSTQLLIANEVTGAIEIGGTFPLDNVEAFARLAEEGLGITARREAGQIVLSGN